MFSLAILCLVLQILLVQSNVTRTNRCLQEPCYKGVKCEIVEYDPHYQCEDCPSGYVGDGETCEQMDTCGKQACLPGVSCQWTETFPHFECGSCPEWYEAEEIHCSRNACLEKPCYAGVNCTKKNTVPYFICGGCPVGLAGNGVLCGKDSDQDGYPDVALSCSERQCTKDNCLSMPNPGQEDGNGNGIGDVSERDPCLDRPCYAGASCSRTNTAPYFRCGRCPVGFAGNGLLCGKDSDHDGYPDVALSCSDRQCAKDNCLNVPNSGQEDVNRNGVGDVCESDADFDGVTNKNDNCPNVANPRQEDSDGDKIGDRCDNCPKNSNTDQLDADGDGLGDVCDSDLDGDGLSNDRDNCKWISNPGQEDRDGDGIGDVCDNCPNNANRDQKDSDGDEVGDVCQTGLDTDGDGIQDNRDNCWNESNADQLDSDLDGIGDACDADKDNDGVINEEDNCVLVSNANQEDLNMNGVGDVCEADFDGDTIVDWLDSCPRNARITRPDFRNFKTIDLDPANVGTDPSWEIRNQGAEIFQKFNSDPELAIGRDRMQGVDFEGTFYISNQWDDDFVGFVFGFVNNRKFYVASWKKGNQVGWYSYNSMSPYGTSGILLKLVNSNTGPGKHMLYSLWHDQSVAGQTKLLWQDPNKKGWVPNTSYRWKLLHRPSIGLIRFRLYRGAYLEADSGNIFDQTIKGGRLGVYCLSQQEITWSNLVYRCNENIPQNIFDAIKPRLSTEQLKKIAALKVNDIW